MYLAPASAELCLYLSKATKAAIGTEAVSSPIKNSKKLPEEIIKYIPNKVESVKMCIRDRFYTLSAQKVDTIRILSPSMNKEIKNVIILPQDYERCV